MYNLKYEKIFINIPWKDDAWWRLFLCPFSCTFPYPFFWLSNHAPCATHRRYWGVHTCVRLKFWLRRFECDTHSNVPRRRHGRSIMKFFPYVGLTCHEIWHIAFHSRHLQPVAPVLYQSSLVSCIHAIPADSTQALLPPAVMELFCSHLSIFLPPFLIFWFATLTSSIYSLTKLRY